MNLTCFESFKLFEPLVEECVLKVSNLFEILVDQHYKVVSDKFDVF